MTIAQQVNDMVMEIARLNAQLTEIKSERDALREERDQRIDDYVVATDSLRQVMAERDALREERDAERKHANMVRDRLLGELAEARVEIKRLEAEIERLNQEVNW